MPLPPRLTLLPENPRYLQWKGLPLFVVHTVQRDADPSGNASSGSGPAFDARRFFCKTEDEARTAVTSSAQYEQMRRTAQELLANDVVLPLVFFNPVWCAGTDSDELIRRAVEATWDLPNVVYAFASGRSSSEAWVRRFRQIGQQRAPDMSHLFASFDPADRHVDLLLARGQGHVPLVPDAAFREKEQRPVIRIAVDSCQCRRGPKCSFDPADCSVSVGSPTFQLMRQQVLAGVHSGQPLGHVDAAYRAHLLQLRWYIENIRTWGDEPGDEITEARLPVPGVSGRPRLRDADGFAAGARVSPAGVQFAVVYVDPEGEPPALAEVWIDRNGDGRFAPDPTRGERIPLSSESATGTGTRFVSPMIPVPPGTSVLRYLFRFADAAWNPPEPGGATAPHALGGYGYDARLLALPQAR